MKDKRVLYISSEVVPYLPETEISSTAFQVAKMTNQLVDKLEFLCHVLVILMKEDINYMK